MNRRDFLAVAGFSTAAICGGWTSQLTGAPGTEQIDAVYKGFTIKTDQPIHQDGDGSAPAPFDLFLASIGTCAALYLLSFCQSRGIATDGVSVTLKTEFDENWLYFSSSTFGFSYFAISAKEEGVETVCAESWSCGEWSGCTEAGIQTRTCVDKNNCGTVANKPAVSQSCTSGEIGVVAEEKPKEKVVTASLALYVLIFIAVVAVIYALYLNNKRKHQF